mmetsp:Transcript_37651/g.97367  ORF Transcript_37651/g.97367 Transcript_37651/m.97367 type:complete len:291 (-) Transcript_37651:144-1016(-)
MHDDDAPLTQLGKAKKFSDDTPLASLAAGASKIQSPAGGKGRPKSAASPKPAVAAPGAKPGAAKGKGKGPPGKGKGKRRAASSSSSSSSDSSSSSSSGGPLKKKKVAAKKKAKAPLVKKGTEDNIDGGGAVKNRDRSNKEAVVAQLLCRWWYALPDWPPNEEAFYEAELRKRSLIKVAVEEWEWLPDVNAEGLKKVYMLAQFRGVYRNTQGELIDLRPKETCPCYSNFMKKDLIDLYDLLIKAYENQLAELKTSKYNETETAKQIKVALTHIRDKAYQANAMSAPKKLKP